MRDALRPEMANLKPEMAKVKPPRTDLRPEKPDLRPERDGGCLKGLIRCFESKISGFKG